MEQIKQISGIVGGIFISILSSSGILYWITKWYGNFIADKLSQKYAHQLSEELEKHKTILNRKLYINQKHFDLELSIYKDLMGAIIDMTESSRLLFPIIDYVPGDKDEEIKMWKSRYKKAISQYNHASEIIFKNAPFMDKEIYNGILELRRKCHDQIIFFNEFRITQNYYGPLDKEQNEVWEKSQEIVELV